MFLHFIYRICTDSYMWWEYRKNYPSCHEQCVENFPGGDRLLGWSLSKISPFWSLFSRSNYRDLSTCTALRQEVVTWVKALSGSQSAAQTHLHLVLLSDIHRGHHSPGRCGEGRSAPCGWRTHVHRRNSCQRQITQTSLRPNDNCCSKRPRVINRQKEDLPWWYANLSALIS